MTDLTGISLYVSGQSFRLISPSDTQSYNISAIGFSLFNCKVRENNK